MSTPPHHSAEVPRRHLSAIKGDAWTKEAPEATDEVTEATDEVTEATDDVTTVALTKRATVRSGRGRRTARVCDASVASASLADIRDQQVGE